VPGVRKDLELRVRQKPLPFSRLLDGDERVAPAPEEQRRHLDRLDIVAESCADSVQCAAHNALGSRAQRVGGKEREKAWRCRQDGARERKAVPDDAARRHPHRRDQHEPGDKIGPPGGETRACKPAE